jgi:hypothetical protein
MRDLLRALKWAEHAEVAPALWAINFSVKFTSAHTCIKEASGDR